MDDRLAIEEQIMEQTKAFVKNSAALYPKCPDCGHHPWERGSPDNEITVKLTRQVLENSNAFNLVSVQPMDSPHAKFTLPSGSHYWASSVTTKYAVTWSPDAVQDLRVDTSNFEEILQEAVATEVTCEIDRWLISEMVKNAAVQRKIDFDLFYFDLFYKSGRELRGFIKDQALKTVEELQDLTGRYSNWLVASPEMVDLFVGQRDPFNRSIHVNKVGIWETSRGNITVFEDALMENQILFGYKGESNLDSGCVYGPYVLLNKTPAVLDPETFTPRMGLMHRGHINVTNNSYYGVLKMFRHTDIVAEKQVTKRLGNHLTLEKLKATATACLS